MYDSNIKFLGLVLDHKHELEAPFIIFDSQTQLRMLRFQSPRFPKLKL